jgi:hypothetical protein
MELRWLFSRLFGLRWQSPRCCCPALRIPKLLRRKPPPSGLPQVGASRHPKNREWIRTGSARSEGVIPVAKGHWSDDRTFVLQFEDLGGDNQRIAELSFNDDTIEVTSTTDEGRSAKARGQAAD